MATILELAQFSRTAYGDAPPPNPTKWTLLKQSSANEYGYFGQAYINEETHEVVITHRGTRPTSLADLLSDIKLTAHISTNAQDLAAEFALSVATAAKLAYGDDFKVVNTGHSLGGNDAQAATVALQEKGFNVSAVTFNAPGIGGYAHGDVRDYNVLNIYSQGDLIHLAGGDHLGSSVVMAAGPANENLALPLPLLALSPHVGGLVTAGHGLYQIGASAHTINALVSYFKSGDILYGNAEWTKNGDFSNSGPSLPLPYKINADGSLDLKSGDVLYHSELKDDVVHTSAYYDLSSTDDGGNVISLSHDESGVLAYSYADSAGKELEGVRVNKNGAAYIESFIFKTGYSFEVFEDKSISFKTFQTAGAQNIVSELSSSHFTANFYGSDYSSYDDSGNLVTDGKLNLDGSGYHRSYRDGKLYGLENFAADGSSSGFTDYGKTTFQYDAQSNGSVTNSFGKTIYNYYANGTHTVEFKSAVKEVPDSFETLTTNDSDFLRANGDLYENNKLKSNNFVHLDDEGKVIGVGGGQLLVMLENGKLKGTSITDGVIHYFSETEGGWDLDSVAGHRASLSYSGDEVEYNAEHERAYYDFKDGVLSKYGSVDESVEFADDGSLKEIMSWDQTKYFENLEDGRSHTYELTADGTVNETYYSAPGIYEESSINSSGESHWNVYNDFGSTNKTNDGDGNAYSKTYDGSGKLISDYYEDAYGDSVNTDYLANGSTVKTSTEDSGVTTQTFDTAGRLTVEKVVSSWGQIELTNYGADGSSSGTVTDVDGSHGEFSKSSLGDSHYIWYYSNGLTMSDELTMADGSYSNKEWTESGTLWNEESFADGVYVSKMYEEGHLVREQKGLPDGSTSETFYDALGVITKQTWADADDNYLEKNFALDGTIFTKGTTSSDVTTVTSERDLVVGTMAKIGSSGNDVISVSGLKGFVAGGGGDDLINVHSTNAVLAFNSGDGKDEVKIDAGSSLVLSLAGVDYQALVLKKSGENLILNLSDADEIAFKDWYSDSSAHGVSNLQFVNYSSVPSSTHLAEKYNYVNFDFQAVVSKFEAARTADPALTEWSVYSTLNEAYVTGSDSNLLGGNVAAAYAMQNGLYESAETIGKTMMEPEFGVIWQQGYGTEIF